MTSIEARSSAPVRSDRDELAHRPTSNKLVSTGQFKRLDVNLPVEIERLAVVLDFKLDQTIVPDNAQQASHNL